MSIRIAPWAAIAVICLCVARFVSAGGGETCFKTTVGANCGVAIVLSQVSCGGVTCNLKEIVFDPTFTCTTSAVGLDGCVAVDCQKHIIERECTDTNPPVCVLVSNQASNVQKGTVATGNICGVPDQP